MELRIHRDDFTETFTLGKMYVDNSFVGYTCEDCDRHLEADLAHEKEDKINGQTAIPRGRYKVILSFSQHFGRVMPEVLDVPGYVGVRIHGGNTAADTLGCPLLGTERTADGVRDCHQVNDHLIELLRHAESVREESWLTVE
jgi:hypothetical protein